jgi:phospholipid-binding lipoprotein MlaA
MQAVGMKLSAQTRAGRRLFGGLWLIALGAMAVCVAPGRVHAAASGAPSAAPVDAFAVNDPYEKTNRRFFASHQKIDHAVIRPLALGYQHVVPKPIRDALHNLIIEAGAPMVLANDLVQLRFARAGKTVARFAVNATIGLGGLTDPAAKMGLPYTPNGFGDTMGRYGVKPGPYLFLPLFGPTDIRDMIGKAVDFAVDPVGWGHYDGDAIVRGGVWTLGGMDERARAEPDLQEIESGADPYASMRSYYMQNREAQIRGGRAIKIDELPSFDDGPAQAPPASSQPQPEAPAKPPAAAQSAAPTSATVAAPPSAGGQGSGDAAAFLAAPAAAHTSQAGPALGL